MKLNISPIESHQQTLIAIADNSDYEGSAINTVSFEITAPGFSKKNVPFQPKSINIFNSADLGIGCEDSILPDGLYEIKYTVNQEFIERMFFRVTNVICQIQRLLLSLLAGKCDDWQTYKSAKLMVEGAVSAANECQSELALSLFNQAKSILRRVNNKCNC